MLLIVKVISVSKLKLGAFSVTPEMMQTSSCSSLTLAGCVSELSLCGGKFKWILDT